VPPPAAPPRLVARAEVSIGGVAVDGPLVRSSVERAAQRAIPSFADCYTRAARAAGRDADVTLSLRLVIDETGRARDVSAGSAPLPGLAACVADAAILIRTRDAPDVGVARVQLTVAFRPARP
jgi:hypothetical protein